MEAEKKSWLYTGLALVAGVGLVSILAAPGTAHASAAQTGASSQKSDAAPKRMLLLGDSLAVGLGPPLKKLAASKGIGVAHDGKVGTTSAAWAHGQSLAADLARDNFDTVLVSLGTNDMAGSWTAEQVASYMGAIVDAVQKRGARVVWVAPPRMPTLREEAVRKAIASLGVAVFPSDALEIPRGGDKIHPTAIGYAGWAGAILSWLVP